MDERMRVEHDALREMFGTEGWKILVRNTQERIDAFRAAFPFNVNNEAQLQFARGLLSALDTILKMPDYLDAAEAAEEPDEYP